MQRWLVRSRYGCGWRMRRMCCRAVHRWIGHVVLLELRRGSVQSFAGGHRLHSVHHRHGDPFDGRIKLHGMRSRLLPIKYRRHCVRWLPCGLILNFDRKQCVNELLVCVRPRDVFKRSSDCLHKLQCGNLRAAVWVSILYPM